MTGRTSVTYGDEAPADDESPAWMLEWPRRSGESEPEARHRRRILLGWVFCWERDHTCEAACDPGKRCRNFKTPAERLAMRQAQREAEGAKAAATAAPTPATEEPPLPRPVTQQDLDNMVTAAAEHYARHLHDPAARTQYAVAVMRTSTKR